MKKRPYGLDQRAPGGQPLDHHAREPLRELADVGVRGAQEAHTASPYSRGWSGSTCRSPARRRRSRCRNCPANMTAEKTRRSGPRYGERRKVGDHQNLQDDAHDQRRT